jgi:hypothetical protein
VQTVDINIDIGITIANRLLIIKAAEGETFRPTKNLSLRIPRVFVFVTLSLSEINFEKNGLMISSFKVTFLHKQLQGERIGFNYRSKPKTLWWGIYVNTSKIFGMKCCGLITLPLR